jgi:uncharacterized coiled-coil protein SlyX
LIEDFTGNMNRFEGLLQKVTADTASSIVSERLSTSEIKERFESDVTSLGSLAEQLKQFMLILKPEKAPTIKKRAVALLQSLGNFKEMLARKPEDLPNSKLALEELRRAVTEGSNLLDLAKEIKIAPSETIATVLKLKEIYDTKEYLSAIPVPEAVHVRFTSLKKDIEKLKLSMSSLERSVSELRGNLDHIVEELSKFRPSSTEETEEEIGSEPTLTSED